MSNQRLPEEIPFERMPQLIVDDLPLSPTSELDTELTTISGPYQPAPKWVMENLLKTIARRERQVALPSDEL